MMSQRRTRFTLLGLGLLVALSQPQSWAQSVPNRKPAPAAAHSDDLLTADGPRSHTKALNNMLKGFQRDLEELIPTVNANPNSSNARDFVQVYFQSDTSGIVNHVTPANIRPDKALEPLAARPFLRPAEFLRLTGNIFRNNFEYELDRNEAEVTSLDSLKEEFRQVHRYRITVPVRVSGRPNAQMQVEVRDSLDIYALVYSDGRRDVRYARIQNIQRKAGGYAPAPYVPTPYTPAPVVPAPYEPVPPAPAAPTTEPGSFSAALLSWTAPQKLSAVIQWANSFSQAVSDAQFERIKAEFDLFFDPSGYINLVTRDGKTLRLERRAFLLRARQQRMQYDWQDANIVLYDQFRDNSRGNPICRITTYHEVRQFDNQHRPLSPRVTTVPYVPVKAKPQNAPAAYWQLASVSLREK